jgi:hypothetical protein
MTNTSTSLPGLSVPLATDPYTATVASKRAAASRRSAYQLAGIWFVSSNRTR